MDLHVRRLGANLARSFKSHINLSDYDGRAEPQPVLVRHMMNLLRPWASCVDTWLNNQGVSTTTALGPSPGPAERPPGKGKVALPAFEWVTACALMSTNDPETRKNQAFFEPWTG
jgi:hypothetical protein